METRETALLIVGHGSYATSIKKSIEMIVGEYKNIYFLDFKEEDSVDVLNENILTMLSKLEAYNVLIVADILGGAPFQQASFISLDKENVSVVAGVNLSAILEVVFSLHIDIDEIAKTMVETTINSVKLIN